jgi:hypothetical protein
MEEKTQRGDIGVDAKQFDDAAAEAGLATVYEIVPRVRQQLESVFTYHAPRGDQSTRYVALREAAKALAFSIAESTPPSREQSLALTKLEEAIFFANAAIARNE